MLHRLSIVMVSPHQRGLRGFSIYSRKGANADRRQLLWSNGSTYLKPGNKAAPFWWVKDALPVLVLLECRLL
jgi:hypothetical protein